MSSHRVIRNGNSGKRHKFPDSKALMRPKKMFVYTNGLPQQLASHFYFQF